MNASPVQQEEFCYQVSRITDIPSMPLALQRFFDIINDEVASLKELEGIVRYDQSLSAKLLRISNSSYYGFRGSISSLSRAMAVIGFEEVRKICMSSILLDLVSNRNALGTRQRETLWKHAFAAGKAASVMVEKRPWVNREDAYMLGLLHDFGKLILAMYFSEHFEAIERLASNRKIPFWHAESLYGITHAGVGGWIGRKWGLPEIFQQAMEFHHTPEKSPSFRPEVTLVALADVLANSREYPQLLEDDLTLRYRDELCIPEEEWAQYGKKMAQVWVEVEDLWKLLN